MSVPLDNSLTVRKRYAELLRHFIAGRLTNDQYEDAYFELEHQYKRDSAVWAVFACVWHFYSGTHGHRLDGDHRVPRELRRRVARWIVFLRSGAPLADVRATCNASPKARRSRLLQRAVVWSSLATSLLSLAMGIWLWVGFLLLAVPVFLIWIVSAAMIARTGWSMEPEHAEHAFSNDDSDPWPFRSRAELDAALATPTYLHGS